MALQFPTAQQGSPHGSRSAPLTELAAQHGTPLWVYDAAVIRERIAQLRRFDVIRYAQKANSNIHILKLMRAEERWSTPCRWAR